MAQFGCALDGIDDLIEIKDSSFLNDLPQASIGFKFKWLDSPGGATDTKCLVARPLSFIFFIGRVDHKVEFVVYNPYERVTPASQTEVDDGREHSIFGIFEGNKAKLFIDGKKEAEVEFARGNLRTSAYPIRIGCYAEGVYHSPILVDDFVVYDYALPDEEVWRFQVRWVE